MRGFPTSRVLLTVIVLLSSAVRSASAQTQALSDVPPSPEGTSLYPNGVKRALAPPVISTPKVVPNRATPQPPRNNVTSYPFDSLPFPSMGTPGTYRGKDAELMGNGNAGYGSGGNINGPYGYQPYPNVYMGLGKYAYGGSGYGGYGYGRYGYGGYGHNGQGPYYAGGLSTQRYGAETYPPAGTFAPYGENGYSYTANSYYTTPNYPVYNPWVYTPVFYPNYPFYYGLR